MRRARIELDDIAARPNLALAAAKAAKAAKAAGGKRDRVPVRAFFAAYDANLDRLREALLGGTAPDGGFRAFRIWDPKPRTIHAACFADRVLHHAIMNLAGPVFERSLADSAHACRLGRGSLAAVRDQHAALARWLRDERRLELKPGSRINRAAHGVSFCGYRIVPGALRLSRRRRRNYSQGRAHWEGLHASGEIDGLELQRAYAAVKSITEHADATQWRREELRRRPWIDPESGSVGDATAVEGVQG
ncbi:MAG: hypothetical protein ACPGU7_12440 [Gammaproteobacteria bacterium]